MADESNVEVSDVATIESREAYIEVSRTLLGKESVDSERIRIRPFRTNPAVISVKGGFTVNLGNYESGRVDVFLAMPAYVEEIDKVYEQVKDWVDTRVAKEFKEMKASK